MSSSRIFLPPVSISDVRATDAADRVKSSSHATKEKIEKSAKEFEAVLLAHWLDQAEQTFATVPGSDPEQNDDPGRDQFHSLAIQAIGTALSGSRGGLGIAKMVASHLESTQKSSEDTAVSPKNKGTYGGADGRGEK